MLPLGIIKPIAFAVLKELGSMLAILLCLSVAIFALLYLSPNEDMLLEYVNTFNPADELNTTSSQNNLGFISAYWIWFNSVINGSFGISTSNGMPVLQQVYSYLYNTILLIFNALFLSIVVALILGRY